MIQANDRGYGGYGYVDGGYGDGYGYGYGYCGDDAPTLVEVTRDPGE